MELCLSMQGLLQRFVLPKITPAQRRHGGDQARQKLSAVSLE